MSQEYLIRDLDTRNKQLPIGTHVTIHNDSTIPNGTRAVYLGLIYGCDYADFEVLDFKLQSTSSEGNTTTLSSSAHVKITNMHNMQETSHVE